MKTHKISVTVERDSIRVAPEEQWMSTEDEVHWAGTTEREFSIVFDGGSPFDSVQLSHAAAVTKHQPKKKGRFKYTVVSSENSALRLDPVIEVGDPPSGNP